jgi:hypothetical protein
VIVAESENQLHTAVASRVPATIRLSDWRPLALVAAWSLLLVAGFYALWRHGTTSGDGGEPARFWPTKSRIARDGRPTLLVLAHPLCACTCASLSELERLVTVYRDRVDTQVLFIAPPGSDASWRESDLYNYACRIPGVTVHVDIDRHDAQLFGARTSGSCLLYGSEDRLRLHGGMTASRGPEGDNQGRSTIEAFLLAADVQFDATPVFGSPRFESAVGCFETKCPSK